MNVTEAEARTKRCQESFGPFFTTQTGNVAMVMSGSSYAVVASPSHCIGGACMAWRWLESDHTIDGDFIGCCGKARP